MSIAERDVRDLLQAGVIDEATARRMAEWVAERRSSGGGANAGVASRFDLAHAAYYLGALVILFAMGWFAIEIWQRHGGWLLAAIALVYAAGLAGLGEALWRRGWRVPGGLLFTAAAGMAPLLAFAVQAALGVWPERPGGLPSDAYLEAVVRARVVLEVAMIAAALVAIRIRPFAFHAAALAGALLFLAADLGPLLLGPYAAPDQELMVTLVTGLLLVGVGYVLDHRTPQDYAFWLYLTGLLSFLFSAMGTIRETVAFGAICLLFMLVAVLIRRRAFMVIGGAGLFFHLQHLAQSVFHDSLLFPVALSFIGLAFILGGVAYARRQHRIRAALLRRLPAGLVRSLPQNR